MELKINRNSSLSIHTQLKEQLKGLIVDGEIVEKSQLPTVRQLGDFLQINKNTVSKVYSELESEGYVESLKGKGTFVKYERNAEKIEFLKELEATLKKGMKQGINLDEILGLTYFKSHYFKFMTLGNAGQEIALFECNNNSIEDFKKVYKKEVGRGEVKGILIDDLIADPEKIKEELKNVKLIVIPYIHYNEISNELSKLGDKEVFTIGISQSLKILNLGKKMKNKNVGIIGADLQDELVIHRQFRRMNIKSFTYFHEDGRENMEQLKFFLRKVDFLIISPSKYEKIKDNLKPKKPYVLYEGKYAQDDLKVLKEILED